MDFYGDGAEEFEKCESYTYNGGEVAVKDFCWQEITPAQNEVLLDLCLA